MKNPVVHYFIAPVMAKQLSDFPYLPNAIPTRVPRYELDDPSVLQYLDDNGYVVIKNALSESEIQKGISLAWDYVEEVAPGVKRGDPTTYENPTWPTTRSGILIDNGVGHSELLWFVRGQKKIQNIFQKVWKTDQVLTSFDGFCFHRPWEYNESWKTRDGYWFHVDQNPFHKPEKNCIQGLLNFLPSGETDGGLILVPRSHLHFKDIVPMVPEIQSNGDYIPLHEVLTFWENVYKKQGLQAIKVCLEPGDFILWDSRTVHCNCGASTSRPIPTDGTVLPPRRIVTYVCMTPSSRLRPELKDLRAKIFQEGHTTSHWPEDAIVLEERRNRRAGYVPPKLTEEQKKLIPM